MIQLALVQHVPGTDPGNFLPGRWRDSPYASFEDLTGDDSPYDAIAPDCVQDTRDYEVWIWRDIG